MNVRLLCALALVDQPYQDKGILYSKVTRDPDLPIQALCRSPWN